jgi:hypothetical protein
MDADVDADVPVEIRIGDAEVTEPLWHGVSGMIRDQQKPAPGLKSLHADWLRILCAQKLKRTVQGMTPGLTSPGAERMFSRHCQLRRYRNSVDMTILLC